MFERTSRHFVTNSSEKAREAERFVKPVRLVPDSFTWRGRRIPIDDAWIERECQVHYTLIFFKSYECFDSYKLVIVPQHSADLTPADLHMETGEKEVLREYNHGKGMPFELALNLDSIIPKRVQILAFDQGKVTDTLLVIVE